MYKRQVLTSGCDVMLVPLDSTHAGDVTLEESRTIRNLGTPVAVAVADLLDQRIKAYDMFQPQKIAGSTPPHDALVVASVIDPDVLKDVQLKRVDVDFGGSICDGRTMVDSRVYPDNPPNIHIDVYKRQGQGAMEMLLSAMEDKTSGEYKERRFDLTLVERKSVAAPRMKA